jgi:acetylornithine deacetylase/succinyl-diaminopimelate desuccinylase-like protein
MTAINAIRYARSRRPQFVADLFEFLRLPTVSAQPAHASDMKRCASWLSEHLRHIGLDEVVTMPTSGHPIVYAQSESGASLPTILIYGHYDVQPADDAKNWESPPFTPMLRNGAVYARGASDDKGQMFAHVKALQSYLAADGALPVNVRCIFEGEEETGSQHLASFLIRNRATLYSDAALMSDAQMESARPAITYALRGSLTAELEVVGPSHDLHSGLFGGAIHNPVQALADLLARMHTADGQVAIPGFYGPVRIPPERERLAMVKWGPLDEQICRDAGVAQPWGERNYSLYERTTIRPDLTINGISGGYQGAGHKAVIPSRAKAKLSFRLVPDQDPAEVERLLRRYVSFNTPPTVRTAVNIHSKSKPVVIDRTHPAIRAGVAACARGFGAPPLLLRNGGTVPVVSLLEEQLRIPTVLMGFASPGDHLHGPNESFRLANYYKGIDSSIWFMDLVAKALRRSEKKAETQQLAG